MESPILVVGGSRGIGQAAVQQLQSKGHQVIVACRNAPENASASYLPYDVTNPESKLEITQPISGLIYCPGSIRLKPFHRLTREDFMADMEINLLGAVRTIQSCLPMLQAAESASVVLFSTVAVAQGMPFHASIASAKGAVEGLTRSLAAELAPKVRVNAIAPSLTNTPLVGSLLADEKRIEAAAGRHPLQRIASAEEIASLATMLVSPESASLTGQILHADNGLSSVRLLG